MVDLIQRQTARVIPVSTAGRVLLLQGHDPAVPDIVYWFTIGGLIEPLESPRQAAAREMMEETGIVIGSDELIGPFYRGRHSYTYGGNGYDSRSLFFAVVIEERPVLPVGLPGEVISDARWWYPDDVLKAPLSNQRIPEIARLAVAAATAQRRVE